MVDVKKKKKNRRHYRKKKNKITGYRHLDEARMDLTWN